MRNRQQPEVALILPSATQKRLCLSSLFSLRLLQLGATPFFSSVRCNLPAHLRVLFCSFYCLSFCCCFTLRQCSQSVCSVPGNGCPRENPQYAITLSYEFRDDVSLACSGSLSSEPADYQKTGLGEVMYNTIWDLFTLRPGEQIS